MSPISPTTQAKTASGIPAPAPYRHADADGSQLTLVSNFSESKAKTLDADDSTSDGASTFSSETVDRGSPSVASSSAQDRTEALGLLFSRYGAAGVGPSLPSKEKRNSSSSHKSSSSDSNDGKRTGWRRFNPRRSPSSSSSNSSQRGANLSDSPKSSSTPLKPHSGLLESAHSPTFH